MSTPTFNEQTSLELLVGGLPVAYVTGNSTTNADGLHFFVGGFPYYATSPSGTTPTYNASQFFILF